jgi:putative flippase GtrA
MIALASSVLPGQPEDRAVGENMALAVAVAVVLFWNFGINRVWTYSDVK